MAKYRKKPVVIEAEVFDPEDCSQHDRLGLSKSFVDGSFGIDTLEGRMVVSRGDWIIRGIKGELYPCKPDIFAATYELAEETDR